MGNIGSHVDITLDQRRYQAIMFALGDLQCWPMPAAAVKPAKRSRREKRKAWFRFAAVS